MALLQASIAQLQVGHYIHLPTGWTNHPFMFNAFKIKNQQQLDIIRHLGLNQLMVDLEKSDLSLEPLLIEEDPLDELLSQDINSMFDIDLLKFDEKAFRRSMRAADKVFGHSVSQLREALGALNLKPDEGLANTAQIVRNTAQLLIEHQGPLSLHLIRPLHSDQLLLHSLNVAFIAMLIAREQGATVIELEDIGLAGLVHDIGELKIPTQILQKRGEFTKAEHNFLKLHPQYGLEMLTQWSAFTPLIRQVCYQHHERLDGSGYPLGIKGGEVTPIARLIGLVDCYDEILHPRGCTYPVPPNQVIGQLYKQTQKCFEQSIVSLLIKLMGVYPPGSIVKLSDESIALVLTTEPTMPLKPKILPYIKGKKSEGVSIVDLREDARIISGVLKQEELNEMQKQFFGLTHRFCYYFAF